MFDYVPKMSLLIVKEKEFYDFINYQVFIDIK